MSTPHPVSRRTALVGLAGVGASVVAGCTSGSPEPEPDGPSASATRDTSRPGVDPDVRLAATMLGAEQAMLARVLAVQRRHPRLRDRLAGARATHRAHVDLLASATPQGSGGTGSGEPAARRTPAVARSPAAALEALTRAEERLAAATRRGALAAESGAFARALGSMAAASSQLAAPVTTSDEDRR